MVTMVKLNELIKQVGPCENPAETMANLFARAASVQSEADAAFARMRLAQSERDICFHEGGLMGAREKNKEVNAALDEHVDKLRQAQHLVIFALAVK